MIVKDRHHLTHRRINDVLSIFTAILALYILILPVIPYLSLWWARKSDDTGGYVYQTKLQTDTEINEKSKPIPEENRLVLPTIYLNEEIFEGNGRQTLSKGLWRIPGTSTPDKGGNTVVAGHRFTYAGPAVFYHLDKIKVGDYFALYWEGEEYDYEVGSVKVVSPLDVGITQNTVIPTITLYTCTPLWSAKDRLVVTAFLIGGTNL